jgi:hypothetical protein
MLRLAFQHVHQCRLYASRVGGAVEMTHRILHSGMGRACRLVARQRPAWEAGLPGTSLQHSKRGKQLLLQAKEVEFSLQTT